LFEQEADIELATRSMKNIVVTFDTKKALTEAKQNGGYVVLLSHKESCSLPVDTFMENLLKKVREFKI